jgi:transposase
MMTDQKESVYIGVDVGEAVLDVFQPGTKPSHYRLNNTSRGLDGFLRRLQEVNGPVWVVCEATGGYEKKLVRALWSGQIPVSIVNAKRVRDYARSQGQMAKNDRIDAEVLAEYGRHCKKLKPSLPPSPSEQQLAALVDRRAQVLNMITAEQNRLRKTEDRFIRGLMKKSLLQLKRQLNSLEMKMKSTLEEDPYLNRRAQRLQQVKGVGWVTACILLGKMPELGHIPDKSAAALAGLVPYARDSATIKGKRFIGGGRKLVRNAMYMPALTAARYNEHLSPFYQRLIHDGKPKKIATTAVMRKLITYLNKTLAKPAQQLG